MITRVHGVSVVSWNPRRNRLPYPIRTWPVGRRVNNFGDLLGPLVVAGLRAEAAGLAAQAVDERRVLAVGSILHFARQGDVVWGTGVNAKVDPALHDFTTLDVRAVRGPRTRAWLDQRGIPAPAVYGDPALLLPEVLPELREWAKTKAHALTIVPNMRDADGFRSHPDAIDPRRPLREVLRRIAQSECVVGSSLHGVVISEALGIPAALITPGAESDLKYLDYYEGTGREMADPFAADVTEAVALAGRIPPLSWDPAPLRAAFPFDLWRADTASPHGITAQ